MPIFDQKFYLSDTFLKIKAKHKILISSIVKADRARLMDIALRNAKQALILELSDETTLYHRFEDLQQVLHLPDLTKKNSLFGYQSHHGWGSGGFICGFYAGRGT